MIEITEEREEGFMFGVVYERTRMLDSLRLSMKPALDQLEEMTKEGNVPVGMVPVVAVEQIINWAMFTAAQPVHGMAEANLVAEESLAMSTEELRQRGYGDFVDEIEALFAEQEGDDDE